jgi:hypothetical protein
MDSGYRPVEPIPESFEQLVRTDMHCHECGKQFVAELDYSVTGNHIIECPCGHEHCRVIQDGKITGDRWETRLQRVNVTTRSVWSPTHLQAKTTVVSHYLRDRWLNRSDRPQ